MAHLRNEAQAVEKRKQDFASEIEAGTARLLQIRSQELAGIEQISNERLKDLETGAESIRSDLHRLLGERSTVQDTITQLRSESNDLVSRNLALSKQLQDAESSIRVHKINLATLSATHQTLKEDISKLGSQQEEIKAQIQALEVIKQDTDAQIADLEGSYSSKKERIEREITDLLAKQQELEVAQANMLRQYDQMSEDIAIRTKILDERTAILTKRELKINQDERRIARNASLLRL